MKPKFVVIEGLDGAGKSTAISFIKKYFDDKELSVTYTREPGGTPIAEKIREITLANYTEEVVCPDTELLLIYAGRAQHINNLIKPALKSGNIVVSDRFYWSSMAYQGGGRKLGLDKMKTLNKTFIGDCEPDMFIYLDIEPIVGLPRAKKVGEPDRIEQAGLEFFNRTREVYKKLVSETPNAIEIDAHQPVSTIEKQIYEALDKYFSF